MQADFGVGIESGLEEIDGIWFSTGWVVIIDTDGLEGLELGAANDVVFGKPNSKQANGLIGLLTNDILTREGVFRDAVISALARFLHPELF